VGTAVAGLVVPVSAECGTGADARRSRRALEETIPAFVELLAEHRPTSLGGRSLRELMPLRERRPERLLKLYSAWRSSPAEMRAARPSVVFAVLGQARAANALTPEEESPLPGRGVLS